MALAGLQGADTPQEVKRWRYGRLKRSSDAEPVFFVADRRLVPVAAALGRLGTGSNSLSTHLKFVSKLQDALESGVGNLVDADLGKESARLQSLQTKRQLGVQALSIANQSPSVLLGLFR